MAKKAIGPSIDRLGRTLIPAIFGSVLALTSDAVIAFDERGCIILFNEEAEHLFCHPASGLFGQPIATIFSTGASRGWLNIPDKDGDRSQLALPFPLDGSTTLVSCQDANGKTCELWVRCEKTNAVSDTYVCVAHRADPQANVEHEQERSVQELQRANRRLSGTLRIVLDTLDCDDLGELIGGVLEEIADTMEAAGSVIYIAEPDGLHLRGRTASLKNAFVPQFLSTKRGLAQVLLRSIQALRLRVLPPDTESLRAGKHAKRALLNEETHEVYQMERNLLPPFTSLIGVPIWFGGYVVGIIEVGWENLYPTTKQDAQMLEAVGNYLSVQLMGAFTQMRTEHVRWLETTENELREKLYATGEPTDDDVKAFLSGVAAALRGLYAEVEVNEYGPTVIAHLPHMGMRAIPVNLEKIAQRHNNGEISVVAISYGSDLNQWLTDIGEFSLGVLADAGKISEKPMTFMILRPQDAEPLDSDEIGFVHRCTEDLVEIMTGTAKRMQDKHISQALQLGMKNELQHVDGLSADGIYSSATKDAFVGGDFYDLIRLPDRKAAVIMGDVSGKGVEAASVSAAVKTALGAYAWEGLSPARMVRSLNDFLLGFSRIETFATLFIGLIDLDHAKLTYCSAGHPPAIFYRASTKELEMLNVQSGVVGAFEDMDYRNGHVHIGKDDFLLLYTDGTTEARDPQGNFFGEDGLRDAVMAQVPLGFDGILHRLLEGLDTFTDRNLDDDVAMVAVRFDDPKEQSGLTDKKSGTTSRKGKRSKKSGATQ